MIDRRMPVTPSDLIKRLAEHSPILPIAPEPDAVELARGFLFEKWVERWQERVQRQSRAFGPGCRLPERPVDLSGSCKFTSMFAAVVFGGRIAGNADHQYAVVNGRILDLNEHAKDVRELDSPYEHDADFFGNPDHVESLESCADRVSRWIAEFAILLEPERSPGSPVTGPCAS